MTAFYPVQRTSIQSEIFSTAGAVAAGIGKQADSTFVIYGAKGSVARDQVGNGVMPIKYKMVDGEMQISLMQPDGSYAPVDVEIVPEDEL